MLIPAPRGQIRVGRTTPVATYQAPTERSSGVPATRRGRVLVVGIGGLGCPAAWALARSGISTLGLVDPETVELSNLHRQILHDDGDCGRAKTTSAAEILADVSPEIELCLHAVAVTDSNARRLFEGYDVILDGTDDPATKYLLNDAAVELGIPLVHAGVTGWRGQLMTILPGRSACLRCIFPDPPDRATFATCRDAGVPGPLTGLVGALQAEHALRVLAGDGSSLANRFLSIDARTARFHELEVRPRPGCRGCAPSLSEEIP